MPPMAVFRQTLSSFDHSVVAAWSGTIPVCVSEVFVKFTAKKCELGIVSNFKVPSWDFVYGGCFCVGRFYKPLSILNNVYKFVINISVFFVSHIPLVISTFFEFHLQNKLFVTNLHKTAFCSNKISIVFVLFSFEFRFDINAVLTCIFLMILSKNVRYFFF